MPRTLKYTLAVWTTESMIHALFRADSGVGNRTKGRRHRVVDIQLANRVKFFVHYRNLCCLRDMHWRTVAFSQAMEIMAYQRYCTLRQCDFSAKPLPVCILPALFFTSIKSQSLGMESSKKEYIRGFGQKYLVGSLLRLSQVFVIPK